MLLNDELQSLKKVPLFAGVPGPKLKLLAFASDRVNYRPGEVLFREGDVGDAAYVLLKGRAEVLVGEVGAESQVAEVGVNSIVGEVAILCNVVRTATVRASEPVCALRIRKEHFVKLLTDVPEVSVEIVKLLAGRLSTTTAELIVERNRHAPALQH